MLEVRKKEGTIVTAYQLGSRSSVLEQLISSGKMRVLDNNRYEVFSQEAMEENGRGEIAQNGDWIKIDGSGNPYPNSKEYFMSHHELISGDEFKQIPQTYSAWTIECSMCPEIKFLARNKGLKINRTSPEKFFEAPLWGTNEVAAENAIIFFYNIVYGSDNSIIDVDFNFVERKEFEKNYEVINKV